jgi:hypothetical protein
MWFIVGTSDRNLWAWKQTAVFHKIQKKSGHAEKKIGFSQRTLLYEVI